MATLRVLLSLPALFAAMTGAALGACPCPTFSAKEAVQSASLIFVGKAVASTSEPGGRMRKDPATGGWVPIQPQTGEQRLSFEVSLTVKGSAPKVVQVTTPALSDCGVQFQVGQEYFVFAVSKGGVLVTDACKGNASGGGIAVRAAEVGKVLNAR